MILKNAISYIRKKKKRSFLIFSILTIVLSFLYSALTVLNSSKMIENNFYKASNSYVSIVRKDKNFFTVESVNNLLEKKEIKESVFNFKTLFKLKDKKTIDSLNSVKRDDIDENLKNLINVNAITNSSKDVLFTSGVFSLTAGRGLLKDDKNKILVHEKFLKHNNLKLHDKISLKAFDLTNNSNDKNFKYHDFEIIGTFRGKMAEKHTGLSSDLSENFVFMDYFSSQKAFNLKENEEKLTKLMLFTDSKKDLDIVKNSLSSLDNSMEVENNSMAFSQVIDSVNTIKHIINTFIYCIIAAFVIVLCLVLILWLRERIYEIAIFLSIGISKAKIMLQFILELFLTSIFASFVSLILGNFLVKEIIKSIALKDLENLTNGFKSTFNLVTFIESYIILLVVMVFCVVLTSGIILIQKPKKILSKIS